MRNLLLPSKPRIVLPSGAIQREGLVRGKVMDLLSLGMIPGISGGAGGYMQGGDVITVTADGRDLNELWAEYQQILSLYNAQRDALTNVLTFPVNQVIEDVLQGGDVVSFEKASEYGVPRKARGAVPNFFSLGYSFDWWDVGVGYTWMYLAEADTRQTDSVHNAVLEADNRQVFTEIMKQIFNNTTRVATIRGQNYNVFALYNGDSTVPPKFKNTVFTAPHTHYLTSGAGTVDPGDLTGTGSMYDHLQHHGYSWQEGSALVLMVNSQEAATIRTFQRGVAGAQYDFIQSQGSPGWALSQTEVAAMQAAALAGFSVGAPPATWNGLTVIGRYGPWLIVEDDLVPAGYMLGFASGGNLNASNIVGLREHANAGLRGLRLVKGADPEYPLIDSYYQRGFGTGIRQRGAGAVMKITAGAYSVPAGFTW